MATPVDNAPRLQVALEDEHDRYHRQSLISWWDQERLRQATIVVVGAGALGNELVKNLALVGVRRVVVVDLDRVENSNLSRCVFFRESDEGLPKAEVVAAAATELNPEVEVLPVVGDVRLTLGLGAFAEADVVLGGLDNREARLFVNQACWKTGTPWVDGAIEGLMGVVRSFVPPDSACYECTMSERDHELLAARRTCALLAREDILEGKVPTTATSASLVAALQVQEAIKLLHAERLSVPPLAGAGFHLVGLTHDSYAIAYRRRDDCISHDTYDLSTAAHVAYRSTFARLLEAGRERLGNEAVLELEHEIAIDARCRRCATTESILRPVDALSVGAALCPGCGEERGLTLDHGIEDGSPLLEATPEDLRLPPGDVVTATTGLQRHHFLLDGGRPTLDALAETRA